MNEEHAQAIRLLEAIHQVLVRIERLLDRAALDSG